MNDTTTMASPLRVRIASHVTQSRFLHVEDSLAIGKVRLFAGTYRKGSGMQEFANFYQEIADARVVFAALAEGRDGFQYKEYKGTPGKAGSAAESRVMSVAVKGENVYIELKAGPGKETATGAVTPAGAARVAVNVTFKRHEAARLAVTVLAYLHAWDVVRMMAQRQVVGKIRPYELVATEGVRRAERGTSPELAERVRNGGSSSIPHSSRPVTRKGDIPGNGVATQRANGNGRARAMPAPSPSPARTAMPAPPPVSPPPTPGVTKPAAAAAPVGSTPLPTGTAVPPPPPVSPPPAPGATKPAAAAASVGSTSLPTGTAVPAPPPVTPPPAPGVTKPAAPAAPVGSTSLPTGTAVPAPPPPPAPTPTYGNGSRVDANNLTEMETFVQYVAEKKATPESKSVLLAFYQQRAQQTQQTQRAQAGR